MSVTKVQITSRKRLRPSSEEPSLLETPKKFKLEQNYKLINPQKPEDVITPSTAEAVNSFTSKELKETTTKVKPEIIESISEIKFSARHQSILSITHFKEPLRIQTGYPIPEIEPHEILVYNRAIGLNPIDWKGKKYGFGIYHFPWINGRESSGDIVKIGKDVKGLAVGDQVIVSSTSYRDNRTSTFQQYTVIDSRLVWKLPQNFTYEDGATIGVGLVTAGILLYNSFGFDLDLDLDLDFGQKIEARSNIANNNADKGEEKTILIWGGATVVGIYVAQLAKLYGLKVISIASLRHKSYLEELGVDVLIDRHLSTEEIEKQIEDASPNGISFGVDCVSKETSAKVVNFLDQRSKSLPENLVKPAFAGIVGKPKETPSLVDVREVVIKRFHEDTEFGAKFIKTTTHFLDKHLIKPVKYKQYRGGLEILEDALKDLETIGANGEKYVVSV